MSNFSINDEIKLVGVITAAMLTKDYLVKMNVIPENSKYSNMAPLAVIIGGSLVNALAFSGTNALFYMVSSERAQAEQAKRDDAIRAAEVERVKVKDFMNNKYAEESHAQSEFDRVDDDMVRYANLHSSSIPAPHPASLDNYYEPSEFIRIGEPLLIVGFMGGLIYLANKYID